MLSIHEILYHLHYRIYNFSDLQIKQIYEFLNILFSVICLHTDCIVLCFDSRIYEITILITTHLLDYFNNKNAHNFCSEKTIKGVTSHSVLRNCIVKTKFYCRCGQLVFTIFWLLYTQCARVPLQLCRLRE